MSALLIIVIVVLIFVAIFILISNNIPNTWTIEQAVLVNAPNTEIFPYIKDLSLWQDWTVWSPDYETNLTFEYTNTITNGIGAVQKWISPNLNAELTITALSPLESIDFTLKLHHEDIMLYGTIVLGVADTYFTQVAWRCQLIPTTKKNFVQKYIAYNLRKSFNEDLKESLQNLVQLFANKFPSNEDAEMEDSISEDNLA